MYARVNAKGCSMVVGCEASGLQGEENRHLPTQFEMVAGRSRERALCIKKGDDPDSGHPGMP